MNRFFAFVFIILLSQVSYGSSFLAQNMKFLILSENNTPEAPIISVDKDLNVTLSNGVELNLNGLDEVAAKNKIIEMLGFDKERYFVKILRDEELSKVTILGDIDAPGNFWIPKNAKLSDINLYNHIFDDKYFSSSFTVVRGGYREIISEGNINDFILKGNDVVLVDLTKVKVEVIEAESNSVKSHSIDAVAKSGSAKDKSLRTNVVQKEITQKDVIQKEIKPVSPIKNPTPEQNDNSQVLHPGDILRIDLPGEKAFDKDFLISRKGKVKLPEVGELHIMGKTLVEADRIIRENLSEVFIRLEKLSITLKEQRLLISVLGFVQKPGEVELSNNGNVQTAINKAGGMLDGAQLDKLQLQRSGKVIEFNYKKYLDSGDHTLIPELEPLDRIFVPASPQLGNIHGQSTQNGVGEGIDPTQDRSAIKVFGEVSNSSTLPFKKGMSTVDALLFAGGVTRYANVEQIRVIDSNGPRIFNLKYYLDSGDQSLLSELGEGSTVFVPKQVDAVKTGGRIVYVMGQVQKPGAFETGDNVNFLDVLANAGGPNRYADTARIGILRLNGEVVNFSLQDYADGDGTPLPNMLPGDAIFVPQKDVGVDRTWLKLPTNKVVHLLGAVNTPGRYEYDKKITFMDLVAHAGGPSSRADLTQVKITSKGPAGELITEEFNLQNFLDQGGNWSLMPKLKGGSTIVFPEMPASPTDNKANWLKLTSDQSIYIMGSVVAPGRYAFNDQLGLLDILSAAEGPSPGADLTNIRIIHRNDASPKVSKLNMVQYFETGDETLLPSVEIGDTIYVPSRDRSWVEKSNEQTVRVLGAIKTSGRYDFTSDMSILDLLAEAGGPSKTAYIEKIIIMSSTCCESQAYTFDLMSFMKNPDVSRLPLLRPGDTVFIPDSSNTQFAYIMNILRDMISIVSLFNLTTKLIPGLSL